MNAVARAGMARLRQVRDMIKQRRAGDAMRHETPDDGQTAGGPDLEAALDTLLALLATPRLPAQQLVNAVQAVAVASQSVTMDQARSALRRLIPVLPPLSLGRFALAAVAGGALVERGADGDALRPLVLARLPEALVGATAFVDLCRQETTSAGESTDDKGDESDEPDARDPGFIEAVAARVSARHMEAGQAWGVLNPLCTAALALLCRSADARREARADDSLLTALRSFPVEHQGVECLLDLLAVLDDEEILVLHPARGRGYRVRISGIGDNFQLHTLLAARLIGDPAQGWLPGTPPDPRVVAAALDAPPDPQADTAMGVFNLVTWRGIAPDGTLPEGPGGSKHWIWNEGTPRDIEPFEGLRIVLLGPPPYARTWNVGRKFPYLEATLEVLAQLDTGETRAWVQRLAGAQ